MKRVKLTELEPAIAFCNSLRVRSLVSLRIVCLEEGELARMQLVICACVVGAKHASADTHNAYTRRRWRQSYGHTSVPGLQQAQALVEGVGTEVSNVWRQVYDVHLRFPDV